MRNCPLFLGLGSPHGDDQAGWLVINCLHQRGVATGDAVALPSPDQIWHVCSADRELVLCDAAAGPGQVGTIQRWNWPGVRLPERCRGTHDLPLGDVLCLGQSLGLCPSEITIWTISGSRFSPCDELSPSVREAAERLASSLYEACCRA